MQLDIVVKLCRIHHLSLLCTCSLPSNIGLLRVATSLTHNAILLSNPSHDRLGLFPRAVIKLLHPFEHSPHPTWCVTRDLALYLQIFEEILAHLGMLSFICRSLLLTSCPCSIHLRCTCMAQVIFLPTFPTPLPTMLTTTSSVSSSSASRMPQPLIPNILRSRAS